MITADEGKSAKSGRLPSARKEPHESVRLVAVVTAAAASAQCSKHRTSQSAYLCPPSKVIILTPKVNLGCRIGILIFRCFLSSGTCPLKIPHLKGNSYVGLVCGLWFPTAGFANPPRKSNFLGLIGASKRHFKALFRSARDQTGPNLQPRGRSSRNCPDKGIFGPIGAFMRASCISWSGVET